MSRPAAIMMLTGTPEHVAREIAAQSIAGVPDLATPEMLTARFWSEVAELADYPPRPA